MIWLGLLGLAVIIAGFVAVTGIKPKGTRQVAHTRLMWAARLVLMLILIIIGYMIFRAKFGG